MINTKEFHTSMNGQTSICKEFTFAAAHCLPNHSGKCRGLHGHNYKVEVHCQGLIHPIDGTSGEGMLIDFYQVKDVFTRLIFDRIDHRYLNEVLKDEVPVTTAEVLSAWMLLEIRKELPEAYRVVVWETENAWAAAEIPRIP